MKFSKTNNIAKTAFVYLFFANGFAFAQSNNSTNADPIGFPDINKKGQTVDNKTKNINGIGIMSDNSGLSTNPIYIINGERIENLNAINPNKIKAITVYKGKKAIELYGDEAKNGVIVIEADKDYLKKSEKDLSRDDEILAI